MHPLLRAFARVFRPASSREAQHAMLHVAGAVAAFGVWHSWLCSTSAKKLARRLCGERAGRAFYRLFFNLQSIVTMAALVLFVVTRPQRIIYRAQGVARLPFWMVQGSALLIALWSLRELRLRRFSGVQGVRDWRAKREEVAEPETQTPDGADGPYERGPYKWSRHPIEWAPLFLLWFTPTLKTNWVSFNLVTTIYMVIGVGLEEKRLSQKGGEAYARYRQRVGLFFGRRKGQDAT